LSVPVPLMKGQLTWKYLGHTSSLDLVRSQYPRNLDRL